jgi:signal transduction histidine kinase
MEKAGVYKHEVIDIGKMLEGVKDELAGVNGREIAIGLTCECACRVQANELLKDVFTNLVGNAIKHSDPVKPLRIDITTGKTIVDGRKFCKVIVEDNGPGIPDEARKELLDRLAQDKPHSIGKGFGLYLARMLVKDYEGSLTLEDHVTGDYSQGCRFVVWLPAAE